MCMIQVIIIVMASQWSNHWIMGTLVQPEVWTVGLQRIKDRRGQTWNKTFQETSLVSFDSQKKTILCSYKLCESFKKNTFSLYPKSNHRSWHNFWLFHISNKHVTEDSAGNELSAGLLRDLNPSSTCQRIIKIIWTSILYNKENHYEIFFMMYVHLSAYITSIYDLLRFFL